MNEFLIGICFGFMIAYVGLVLLMIFLPSGLSDYLKIQITKEQMKPYDSRESSGEAYLRRNRLKS